MTQERLWATCHFQQGVEQVQCSVLLMRVALDQPRASGREGDHPGLRGDHPGWRGGHPRVRGHLPGHPWLGGNHPGAATIQADLGVVAAILAGGGSIEPYFCSSGEHVTMDYFNLANHFPATGCGGEGFGLETWYIHWHDGLLDLTLRELFDVGSFLKHLMPPHWDWNNSNKLE